MSVQGVAYLRTRWSYGERPVTAAKLNRWDDNIDAALGLAYVLIHRSLGAGDGIVSNLLHSLNVTALTPPALTVRVLPGYAFIAERPFALTQEADLAALPPPVAAPRKDLVQAHLADGSVSIKEGVEAATPEAPDPDSACLALARLHLRPGMASIKNTDDGVNGYIEDVRVFLS